MAPVRLPGDEREQAVLLEATVRGSRILRDAMLLLALVSALFGSWLVPAAILVILTFAGRVTLDYARERDVDGEGLSERTWSPRYVFGFLSAMLTFAAMSYIGVTGHGLLPVLGVVGTGLEVDALIRSAATGIPAGAAVSFVVFEVVDTIKRRRRSRPNDDPLT